MVSDFTLRPLMAHEISFTLFITNTIQNIITRFLRNNNGFSMFGKRPGINAKYSVVSSSLPVKNTKIIPQHHQENYLSKVENLHWYVYI